MAPSKASKTPRSSAPKPTRTTPQSKKKPAPNASILNFFKKAQLPEESLFVGEARVSAGREWKALAEQETGLYDEESIDDTAEQRYNEVEGSLKRRRVVEQEDNCAAAEGPAEGNGVRQGVATNGKKKRRGPFLDDSDSDPDEEDGNSLLTPVSDTKMDEDDQAGALKWQGEQRPVPIRECSIPDLAAPDPSHDPEPLGMDDFAEDGFLGNFDEADFPDEEDLEGEEFRERRFLEEQARIEAEETGAPYSTDDTAAVVTDDSSMTESCPICNASLAGASVDEATVHVNACLDGNPVPVPVPGPSEPSGGRGAEDRLLLPSEQPTAPPAQVDGPEISKRFARAAQPRPGQANPFDMGGGSGAAASAFTKLMSGHAEDAAWATAAASENASRGKQAYERTCPFYKIMPGFYICVDAFRYGAVQGCRAYFLSHFHSDHYIGLTANWCHGPIYCSRVTGSLVKSQLRTAAKWVVELDFDETVPVPDTDGVSVTMIPANHCPGSSMFLFEKKATAGGGRPGGGSRGSRTQRILHCGDFRACADHIGHPLLQPDVVDSIGGKTRQQKIDVCYLDTTYLNPRYSFPPQEDVITACAGLCASLNQALKDGNESEWNQILRRREGGMAAAAAAGGNEKVSKFFTKAAAAHPDDDDESAPTTTKPPSVAAAPDNALSALGKPPPPRLLVICGTYSIGKERICKAVAQALGTRIWAPAGKRRIVAQLGDPELTALMTADPAEAQVHMQMLAEMRADTLAEYLATYKPHFSRVVAPINVNFGNCSRRLRACGP